MEHNDLTTTFDRLPPCNIETEESILGGILLDPDATSRLIAVGLQPEDFLVGQHQQIYRTALSLHRKGLPTDLMTMATKLQDSKLLETIGGQGRLAQLVDRCISTSVIEHYAATVREKAIRRRLISFGHDLSANAHTATDLNEFLTEAKDKIQIIAAAHNPNLGKSEYQLCMEEMRQIELTIDDAGHRVWLVDELAAKYRKSSGVLKEAFVKSIIGSWVAEPANLEQLETEFGSFQDWLLTGWLPLRSLTLLHAKGGVGKTLFVQNLIYHVATGTNWGEYEVKSSTPVLYIQTDTAPPQLLRSIKKRGITHDLPIRYHTSWQVEYIAQLRRWVELDRPGLVVVDSITSVNKNATVSENDTEYARFILYAREIAKEFNCSFLFIHHSNDEGNARGSKAMHNSVDEVWKLDYEFPGDPENCYRHLTMQKSRSRAPMKYRMLLDPDENSWECLGEASIAEPPAAATISARQRILEFLRSHRKVRYTYMDLGEHLAIAEPTVRKELAALSREGLVEQERNPLYKMANTDGQLKNLYVVY